MIKKITTLLLFTLLVTACVERGSTLTPKYTEQKTMQRKTITSSIKIKISSLSKKQKSKKDIMPAKSNITTIAKVQTRLSNTPILETNISEKKRLFSLRLNSDTKNRISGFFIFLIGVMISI